MWNKPTTKQLAKLPRLYETENVKVTDKIIHMHFFMGGSDWYIAEYDGEALFFGFAVLNGDTQMAEWGYISFSELCRLRSGFVEVDRDLHWSPKAFKELIF